MVLLWFVVLGSNFAITFHPASLAATPMQVTYSVYLYVYVYVYTSVDRRFISVHLKWLNKKQPNIVELSDYARFQAKTSSCHPES